jgi:hypothetical protein
MAAPLIAMPFGVLLRVQQTATTFKYRDIRLNYPAARCWFFKKMLSRLAVVNKTRPIEKGNEYRTKKMRGKFDD